MNRRREKKIKKVWPAVGQGLEVKGCGSGAMSGVVSGVSSGMMSGGAI